MTEPRCFISYSWDSATHKDWVRNLAEKLQINGIFVNLDQWDIELGDDLPHYMETSIRDSNYVLLVCTPNFCQKANLGTGGVGYEKSIATGEIFEKSSPNTKYIPLITTGDPIDALPSYLKSKAYVDFRDHARFEENFERLLRHLHKEPQYIRPPTGPKPFFKSEQNFKTDPVEKVTTSIKTEHVDSSAFKNCFDFARQSLGKAPSFAETWARKNQSIDIHRFKNRFDFARQSLGKAPSFAETWARKNQSIDIHSFKEHFDFARQSLGKAPSFAETWAKKNQSINIHSFKEHFDFARQSLGKAPSFAETWAKKNQSIDIHSFKERFDFARRSLGKAPSFAESWARKNKKI